MLVSAFVFGGIPEKTIKKAFTEADIYVSPPVLKEYREVPLILGDQDNRYLSAKEDINL